MSGEKKTTPVAGAGKPEMVASKPAKNTFQQMLPILIGGGVVLLAVIAVAAVVLVLALGGGSKPVTKSGVQFGGQWYSGSNEDINTYEFFAKGKVKVTYGDGEPVDCTYKVEGETITIDVVGVTQTFSPQKDGSMRDTASGAQLWREIPEDEPAGTPAQPVGIDVRSMVGRFYLDGDTAKGTLSLNADQSFEMTDLDGETVRGEWFIETTGDQEQLNLMSDGESISLMVSDVNTLYYGADYAFYREGTKEVDLQPEDYTPQSIDPDVELNALAEMSDLSMGVRFPGDEFVSLADSDRITLTTADVETAVIFFHKGDDISALNTGSAQNPNLPARTVVPKLIDSGRRYAESFFEGARSHTLLSEDHTPADATAGKVFNYRAVYAVELDGVPMKLVVCTRGWMVAPRGKNNGEIYFIHSALMVNATDEDIAEDYITVFDRMNESKVDT